MKLSYIIFVIFTTLSVLVTSSSTSWSTWWGSDIQHKLSSIFPKKMTKLFKKLPLPKSLLLGISLLEPLLMSEKTIKEKLDEKGEEVMQEKDKEKNEKMYEEWEELAKKEQ